MEMTKKEYIGRLKKELDTIELSYQHLLQENSMIGEDFRSQAAENLIQNRDLEQRIEILNEEIKQLKANVDGKELDLVAQERVKENLMMEGEELLTHFDTMR